MNPSDHDAVAALRATDMWLRLLVEQLEIDPDETVFDVDAVNGTTHERRALARSTLAERLASNAALLNAGGQN